MTRSALGEFERIDAFFKPLAAGCEGALELQDDAAILEPPAGAKLVVTTDALVEGVHFRIQDAPEDVARKALRVNLSDLAAMGARPWRYTLACATPGRLGTDWMAAFAEGLGEDQTLFDVTLIGGDMTTTVGPPVFAVTLFGLCEGEAVTRRGARTGDDVWVSGTIGDAALGLGVLQSRINDLPQDDGEVLIARYRLPEPRVALGARLKDLATACIDVSDGLIADAEHVARTSGVRMEIDLKSVPFSGAARSWLGRERGADSAYAALLTGGDDYELLFTAPPAAREMIAAAAAAAETPVNRIGRCFCGNGVGVRGLASDLFTRRGWTHF